MLFLVYKNGVQGNGLGALIAVNAGGGAGSVSWTQDFGGTGSFDLRPAAGDRLTLSIYYDRHGHTYYTVTDLNQRVTRSVRVTLSSTPRARWITRWPGCMQYRYLRDAPAGQGHAAVAVHRHPPDDLQRRARHDAGTMDD